MKESNNSSCLLSACHVPGSILSTLGAINSINPQEVPSYDNAFSLPILQM